MRTIKKYVESIEEELEDAQRYAENYIEHKVRGDMSKANRYHEMAEDELKHAGYIHGFATEEIQNISKVYTAPVEMQEKWEKEHKRFVEKTAWIRQMLVM